jgi:hypothetical protein
MVLMGPLGVQRPVEVVANFLQLWFRRLGHPFSIQKLDNAGLRGSHLDNVKKFLGASVTVDSPLDSRLHSLIGNVPLLKFLQLIGD